MRSIQHLGKRIRALRLREGLSQTAMAERLGVSASYLNLIEHDRRPLSANLLIRLSQFAGFDMKSFAEGEDTKLAATLMEVFGDPIFEGNIPSEAETRELAASNPEIARAMLHLHHAFLETRGSAATLAAQVLDRQDLTGIDRGGMASEQVTDLIQRYRNHFPELEGEAERLWPEARLEAEDLFGSMAAYLEKKHKVKVQVMKAGEMGSTVRHYDPKRRRLQISEVLRRGSRNFQLAYQIGLLDCSSIVLPDALGFLSELAHNVWWSFSFDAIDLFRRVDGDLDIAVRSGPLLCPVHEQSAHATLLVRWLNRKLMRA